MLIEPITEEFCHFVEIDLVLLLFEKIVELHITHYSVKSCLEHLKKLLLFYKYRTIY